MEPLQARLLLPLTALAVVLAGCATPDDGSDPGNATPPPAATPEEALGLLERAEREAPERIATRATVTRGATTLLTMNGTFDNATGTAYFEIRGDPSVLQSMGQGGAEGSEELGALFANGFAIHVTRTGSLYLANGTAFTFPPSNDTDPSQSFVPSPDEGPFGAFLEPRTLLAGLSEENVTVKSVKPTTLRNKAALEIVLSRPAGNATVEPVVHLFTDPVRIARVEGVAPTTGDDPLDPFAGARFAADFYYDGEARMDPPEAVTRSLGLAYRSDRELFSFGAPEPFTWTFLNDGGVALADVEVQVKDDSDADSADFMALLNAPATWSMKLSEGTKTQDGVTFTFTDVDADGKVSAGDTLRVDFEGDQPPTVVLHDLKTGTNVVPGPGLALGLLAFAGLALLARRRS